MLGGMGCCGGGLVCWESSAMMVDGVLLGGV